MRKLITLTNPNDFTDLEYAEISIPKKKSVFFFHKLYSAKGCVSTYAKTLESAKQKFKDIFGDGAVWSG